MSREHSHFNSALSVIGSYGGDIPLAAFLKNFFAANKKYGSKDRKVISDLCYTYYRLGNGFPYINAEERLLTSLFLCNDEPNKIIKAFSEDLNQAVNLSLEEKAAKTGVDLNNIFPFNNWLTDGVDVAAFNQSFLVKPKLFARIRPGKKQIVIQKLEAANIQYTAIGENALAFENGVKLQDVLQINQDVVIQDLQSQRVAELMELVQPVKPFKVWDCCAASGGKSILAQDTFNSMNLTVSDVRESIIRNLTLRLKQAGLHKYQSFVADITSPALVKQKLVKSTFNFIICDAPCSGSGTWGRTPEQLHFFKAPHIDKYVQLQKSISSTAIPYLEKGGYFLYITCSVFKQENEEVVGYILKHHNLQLVKQELLTGYNQQADTLFAALFRFE